MSSESINLYCSDVPACGWEGREDGSVQHKPGAGPGKPRLIITLCPAGFDPFNTVTYYMKLVTTSVQRPNANLLQC